MEPQGFDSQSAPGYATHPEIHATNPQTATTTAATEKKGIAGKVKELLGGHGHKTTDTHHQGEGGVYGDATPTTGNAASTRVGCLDKIKAKAGVGHGLAPVQTRAQPVSDPSASPDFNGGTNVNSSAGVHGGWPYPTNPRHMTSAYREQQNQATTPTGNGLENSDQPGGYGVQHPNYASAGGDHGVENRNHAAPASGFGVPTPNQAPPTGGYGVQHPNPTAAGGDYGVQNQNHAAPATGFGVPTPNQAPPTGGYGVQHPNPTAAGGDYGVQNPNHAAPATGFDVPTPNQVPPTGVYDVQHPNHAAAGGEHGVQNPNHAAPATGFDVPTPNQAPPTGSHGVETPNQAPVTAGHADPQPTNPTGVTNAQGGAVLGDHNGTNLEGPRDDSVKKEGFVSKIMDMLHSPKAKPAQDNTTPNSH